MPKNGLFWPFDNVSNIQKIFNLKGIREKYAKLRNGITFATFLMK
jgi:hypothetical protein